MFNDNEDVQMNMTADNAEREAGSKIAPDETKTSVRMKKNIYEGFKAKCKAAGCSTNEVFVRAIDYVDEIIADITKERKEKADAEKLAELNRLAEEYGYSLVTKKPSSAKKKTAMTTGVNNNVNSNSNFVEEGNTQPYEKRHDNDDSYKQGACSNGTDGLNEGVRQSGVVTASANGGAANQGVKGERLTKPTYDGLKDCHMWC